jgi:sporulation protein YlmC with PRC-barrel domain
MEIQFGSKVKDKNGKTVGTVNYIVNNTWTGEVSKFMVIREDNGDSLFFSVEDVIEVTASTIKVKQDIDELTKKQE